MNEQEYADAFEKLTGNKPFPWQWKLYEEWFAQGKFPATATLPTGLGKTMVIAVWLLALATAPKVVKVPRRLVYVVNRRTVVDQSTREAEKLRENLIRVSEVERALIDLCSAPPPLPKIPYRHESPLAISTLRGQFADNREWSADPSRPAVIVGTVDMIGSRLLFSGYGCGFKTRPLHAGFLGQDALLVHDEAHLEPAFQELIVAIEKEQKRCNDFAPLRVMELTATARSAGKTFGLTDEDRRHPIVIRRTEAKKAVHLHEVKDEKKLAEEIAALALEHKESGKAVLVFIRKVDDVEKVIKKLPAGQTQQLTGTLRGYERDRMADPRREDGCPIFARFLPPPSDNAGNDEKWNVTPQPGTVYLVCTSAGEVGVNISADHLVCDLSTFDSMAQRFGRVNRFGNFDGTRIDVVYPKEFDSKDDQDARLERTLGLLQRLNGDGCPTTLGTTLRRAAEEEGSGKELDTTDKTEALRKYILSVFAQQPTILPTSDILFDAWALTSVRDKLPGRPPVEPYLHGIAEWEPPKTLVAWREEVDRLQPKYTNEQERAEREPADRRKLAKLAEKLLDDFSLKSHELLQDNMTRVRGEIDDLAADKPTTPAWVVDEDGKVEVCTLADLAKTEKRSGKTEYVVDSRNRTILLPPSAGGLRNGMLDGGSNTADDVSCEWFVDEEKSKPHRVRQIDNDVPPEGMRLVRPPIVLSVSEDEDAASVWYWFTRSRSADDDGSKPAREPIPWQHHTDDVTTELVRIAAVLFPDDSDMRHALRCAALCHDLGKMREVWQRSIGNPNPKDWHAKSGKPKTGRLWKPIELTDYRHEFGSLLDATKNSEFDKLDADWKLFVLHVIATHHGRGRPHFPPAEAFDPERPEGVAKEMAGQVPQRFGRLQRTYGRWGLAYLESLLRAADYAASARPSAYVEDAK